MATPQHPGRVLAERMREAGISANKLAADISVPTNRLTLLINGERNVTADTALRISRWFGDDAYFWMELQARFELHVVGKKLARALAKMPTQREREA